MTKDIRLFLTALLCASLIACGLRESDGSVRTVYGDDDRQPVMNAGEYPWSTIGRLDVPSSTQPGWVNPCTAVLVGKHIALTSAHCLASVDDLRKVRFRLGLKSGVSLANVTVASIVAKGAKSRSIAEDWALIRFDEPLGERFGFISPERGSVLRGKQYSLASYATDFYADFGAAGIHDVCSVFQARDAQGALLPGVLAHNCDSNPGSAGGPIFMRRSDGTVTVAAIHVAARPDAEVDDGCFERNGNRYCTAYSPTAANLAVDSSRFLRAVDRFR